MSKISSKGGSKIPYRTPIRGRITTSKAPKYVPSPAARHLGLSSSRNNERKSPGPSPLSQPPEALSLSLSPTNLNKPLPSPPVAQIISPSSPPKAKRTLVDATVVGHPTEHDWPTLQPKSTDTPVLEDTTPSTENENQTWTSDTRITLEHSNHQRSKELRSKNPYASLVEGMNARVTPSASPVYTHGGNSYPGAFRSLGSDASPLLARPRGTALESPLARKTGRRQRVIGQSATTHNRKRISLPVPSLEAPMKITETCIVRQGTPEPHEAERPLLDDEMKTGTTAEMTESRYDHQSSTLNRFSTGISEPNEDSGADISSRRKYLSKNSLTIGPGPVLTIADDADKFLFGDGNQTPDAMATSQPISKFPLHNRALSALVGHVSRQKERISFNNSNRTITQQSLASGGQEIGLAQIDLEDSTRPPKKECVGPYSNSSSSISMEFRDGKDVDIQIAVDSGSKDDTEECRIVVPDGVVLSAQEIALLKTPYLAQAGETDISEPTPPLPPKNPSRQTSMLRSTLSRSRRSLISCPVEVNTSIPKTLDSSLCTNGQTTQALSRDNPPSLISHIKTTNSLGKTGSKFRDVESTSKMYDDIPKFHLRQQTESQLTTTPLVHSSEKSKNSGKTTNRQDAKIKLKRSIRNIFQKEGKRNEATLTPPELKKAPIKSAGHALTKHFRSSANLSRVTKSEEAKVQPQKTSYLANEATWYQPSTSHLCKVGTWEGQPVPVPTTSSKEAMGDVPPVPILSDVSNLAGSASAICPSTQPNSTGVINKILECVKDLPTDSNDHLIGLQIAEALTHCIEQSQQAKIAAQKAEQYSREAQLHSNMADINLKWLGKLCEPDPSTDA